MDPVKAPLVQKIVWTRGVLPENDEFHTLCA